MSYPPVLPFGQPRPQVVMERVCGEEDPRGRQSCRHARDFGWTDQGVRFLYIYSDPCLRIGLAGVKKMLLPGT
jgi:hypothetical protein